METADIFFWIGALLAFGMGLGCGSYATMPYYRLPNGIVSAGRWIGKRSACPKCDTQLRTRDMIPVFNQLFNGGKCFNCGNKISRVYFMIELSCTITSVLIYMRYGFSPEFLVYYGIIVCMVIVAASDYTYRHVAKEVLVCAILFGALTIPLTDILFDRIQLFFGAVLACVFFLRMIEKTYGHEFGSTGYLKLLCVGALWMNPWWFAGLVLVMLLLMFGFEKGHSKREKPLPYGLFIASFMIIERVFL